MLDGNCDKLTGPHPGREWNLGEISPVAIRQGHFPGCVRQYKHPDGILKCHSHSDYEP